MEFRGRGREADHSQDQCRKSEYCVSYVLARLRGPIQSIFASAIISQAGLAVALNRSLPGWIDDMSRQLTRVWLASEDSRLLTLRTNRSSATKPRGPPVCGDEAPEFLEPVLDKDHPGDRLGLPFIELHLQKSLAIGGDIPKTEWSRHPVSGLLKQQARPAWPEALIGENIDRPYMTPASVNKLLPVPLTPAPEDLRSSFGQDVYAKTQGCKDARLGTDPYIMSIGGEFMSTQTRAHDLDEVRRIVTSGLRGYRARIYLFGSWASGTAGRTSDIDVAVLPLEPIPGHVFSQVRESLEESRVLYPVELVNLTDASEEFRARILNEGVLWSD